MSQQPQQNGVSRLVVNNNKSPVDNFFISNPNIDSGNLQNFIVGLDNETGNYTIGGDLSFNNKFLKIDNTGNIFNGNDNLCITNSGNLNTTGDISANGTIKTNFIDINNQNFYADDAGNLNLKGNFNIGNNAFKVDPNGNLNINNNFNADISGNLTLNKNLTSASASIATLFNVDVSGNLNINNKLYADTNGNLDLSGNFKTFGSASIANNKFNINANGSLNINDLITGNADTGDISFNGNLKAGNANLTANSNGLNLNNEFTINMNGDISGKSINLSSGASFANQTSTFDSEGNLNINNKLFADVNGNLDLSGNLTNHGYTNLANGVFNVDQSGNLNINDNLYADVNGNLQFNGNLSNNGNTNLANGIFKVDQAGNLNINNKIYADTSGNIDLSGQLYASSGVNIANGAYKVDASGNLNINNKIYADTAGNFTVEGNTNLADGVFKVDQAGNLNINNKFYADTAGNLDISGNLHTANGKFAVDTAGNLNLNNNAFTVDSSGNVTALGDLTVANITLDNAKFKNLDINDNHLYIDASGNLTSKADIDISGHLSTSNHKFYVDGNGNLDINGNFNVDTDGNMFLRKNVFTEGSATFGDGNCTIQKEGELNIVGNVILATQTQSQFKKGINVSNDTFTVNDQGVIHSNADSYFGSDNIHITSNGDLTSSKSVNIQSNKFQVDLSGNTFMNGQVAIGNNNFVIDTSGNLTSTKSVNIQSDKFKVDSNGNTFMNGEVNIGNSHITIDSYGNLSTDANANMNTLTISGLATFNTLPVIDAACDLSYTNLSYTQNVATRQFVRDQIDQILGVAPGLIHTFEEIRNVLEDPANGGMVTSITTQIASRATISNPGFNLASDGLLTVNTNKFTIDASGNVKAKGDLNTDTKLNVNERFTVVANGDIYANGTNATFDLSLIDFNNTTIQSNGTANFNNVTISGDMITQGALYTASYLNVNDKFQVDSTGTFVASGGANASAIIDISYMDISNTTFNSDGLAMLNNVYVRGTLATSQDGTKFDVDNDGNLHISSITKNDTDNHFKFSADTSGNTFSYNMTTIMSTTASDVRLKENIITIDNCLDKVMRLRGVYYEWKDKEKFNADLQIGLIAQEVQLVVPELVYNTKHGFLSVNYQQMVAILIEAMKEQQQTIDALVDRVTSLETI